MNYQDYVRLASRNYQAGSSESGGGLNLLSEGVWNSMSPEQQSAQMGNLTDLSPGDPGYDAARAAIEAAHPNSDIRSIAVGSAPGGADPSKTVRLPDGTYAWSVDNSNLVKDSDNWKTGAAGVAAVVGGGMLGNALMGGSALGASGLPAGLFDPMAGLGYSGSIADTLPAMSGAELGGAAGGSYGGLGAGGLDPETMAGQGGMGVSQNGIGPGSLTDRLAGAVNNPASLTSGNGLLSSTASWIAAHPADALRIGLGSASLISALSGAHSGSGSGGGPQGMEWQNGQIPSFNPQLNTPFQQNPYLNYQVPFMPRSR